MLRTSIEWLTANHVQVVLKQVLLQLVRRLFFPSASEKRLIDHVFLSIFPEYLAGAGMQRPKGGRKVFGV